MSKILALVTFASLFLGCSRMEVSVDYDDTYDFKKVQTFMVDANLQKSTNTLFNDRVINAIESELKLKNYHKSSKENADLIFVFHATTKDKSDAQASYGISGGYRGYRRSSMMMSTAHTYNYTQGTLIIDALDPNTQKIVWRSIGVKELSDKKTPQERTQAVNATIKKILEKFPTIKR